MTFQAAEVFNGRDGVRLHERKAGRGRWVPWPQAWDSSQELTWEGPAGVQAWGKKGATSTE